MSAVELRSFGRGARLLGLDESGERIIRLDTFFFQGARTFEFTLDGRPLTPIDVDLELPESASDSVSAGPPSAGTANVSLAPSSVQVNVGHEFTVDIIVDSGIQLIHGIGALLNFDPAFLEVVSIAGGTPGLSELHSEYDNVAGWLAYSRATFFGAGVSGYSLIATVTFKAKAATGTIDTQVAFNSETVLNFLASPHLAARLTGTSVIINP